jgi:hypothetical protein
MYKLIAIDMDGTLLNHKKQITEGVKEAIQKARHKGVQVVLATGRPTDGIEKYLKELDMLTTDDYAVSFNGCMVQNVGTKEVIHQDSLKGEDLHLLYEISKELGVYIHAFSKEGCIAPVMSKYTKVEGDINDIPIIINDFSNITKDEPITKIMMVDEPEELERAMENLPKALYEKYTIVRSAPYFLEFLNKKSNKGEAVKALAMHLGIKQEEVMCIGDAPNDLHMIEYAGLGVAMGNAFEEVKEIANFITSSNDEEGVAEVIKKFVLETEE